MFIFWKGPHVNVLQFGTGQVNQYEKENAHIEKDVARKRLVLKISCVQHYITGAEIHATDVDFDREKSHEVFYRALFILFKPEVCI